MADRLSSNTCDLIFIPNHKGLCLSQSAGSHCQDGVPEFRRSDPDSEDAGVRQKGAGQPVRSSLEVLMSFYCSLTGEQAWWGPFLRQRAASLCGYHSRY